MSFESAVSFSIYFVLIRRKFHCVPTRCSNISLVVTIHVKGSHVATYGESCLCFRVSLEIALLSVDSIMKGEYCTASRLIR